MKKQDIIFEVTELTQIREALQQLENQADIDGVVIRLSGNMNDLLSEADYADAAEAILEVIDGYDRHDNTRGDILVELSKLIAVMQEDLNKVDRAEDLREMRDEMKAVCNEIVGVIRRETKAACKEINEAIKQDTPKCSGAIAAFKRIPKKMERNLKRGIRNWLNDDSEK